MALKKLITNQKGVTTSYHKVKEVAIRKSRSPETNDLYLLTIGVSSFTHQSYREISEDLNAGTEQYTLTCTLSELAKVPLLELCYGKLKDLNEFAKAEDC